MKTPNWLYCFSEEKQPVDDKSMIGMLCLSSNRIDQSINLIVDLEPEEVAEFTFEENLHYALSELGILGKYCDAFFNVNSKDVTYAALKNDYTIMLLIDSKKKEKKIQEIALELFEQWYDLRYLPNDVINEKLIAKYAKRKQKLEQKIKKFNVLK